MALIKLFSGMDFSGKSTTIERVLVKNPNVFRKQSKFITPIETLQIMIDQNIWVPKEVFIPLLYELVTEDIRNYRECGPILQDTLWVIKFIARLWAEDGEHYKEEIKMLLRLVEQYPDMDSFYLTTTLEARRERYKNRLLAGKRISRSDTIIFDKQRFEATEKLYRKILFKRFPRTQMIDTTVDSPEVIASELVKNVMFLDDIKK